MEFLGILPEKPVHFGCDASLEFRHQVGGKQAKHRRIDVREDQE